MNRYILGVLFYCVCFCACNRKGIASYTGVDTAQIINQVFSSKKIMEDIPDTIHAITIIKSQKFKYYNSSWPNASGRLKLFYVADTPGADEGLKRYSKITDKPLRYVITRFAFKVDSAMVYIYGINQRIDYRYNLLKKNDGWKITKVNWSIE